MVTFEEKEKYLNEEYREAAKKLMIFPSIVGTQYYEGNNKFYEDLKISQSERKRYIGKKVYAGGELNGYYGIIVDVIPDEDGYSDWFVVQDEENPRHFENYDKCELKEQVITTKLIPLR